MHTIVEAVRQFADTMPERIAVIADEQSITYAELWREVRGFAAYLRSLVLPDGSRILVKASTSVGFAVSCFGIHLAGHVHVPLEKTVTESGLNDVAAQLGAAVVVSDLPMSGDYVSVSSDAVRPLAAEYFDDALTFAVPAPDAPCDILFTTGTTGKSKGVIEPHRAVFAVTENVKYGADIPPDNVYLIPAPINHASAIRKLYVSMLTGTTAVLLDGFTNIKKFYDYIERYHVTSILMPPAAVRMILLLSAGELAKYAGQLHHIHTGSAAFPEADKERLCQILPHTRLYFAYGSSEAGCVSMYDYSAHPGLISCVGKPNVNAHIFIVDDDRREMVSSREHQGLIAISGDVVMQGYFNEPELTAGVLQDGVVYTNDIGYIDENGFVYMLGRRGDVINVGGLKIAPTEVENVVLRFPGVAECACFGVEDRMGGTVPKLNVVMERGKTLDVALLREHMAKHLEAFKIPKKIAAVDEIPKTANGKINRKVLQ